MVAGDVFNRYDAPPDLINLMIEYMPVVWAIPGQHDMLHHRYDDLRKSAYWTLVEAGKINHLCPDRPRTISRLSGTDLILHGFPWGFGVKANSLAGVPGFHLAVLHSYVWVPGASYDGAPDTAHIAAHRKEFSSYDAVLIGDNHKPWTNTIRTDDGRLVPVFNHGTATRRHADEAVLSIGPGMLYTDGTIDRIPFDLPEEWTDIKEVASLEKLGVDPRALVELLTRAADAPPSFRAAVRRAAEGKDVATAVRGLLLLWCGDDK